MNPQSGIEDLAGAMALLQQCVGSQKGERLLIVSEPASHDFYDHHAAKLAAAAGRALGLKVYETVLASFIDNDDEKALLLETLHGFDHVVFFSRVGDQIRFSTDTGLPSSTMCYTLDQKALNSEFGTACYHGMSEIKNAIDEAMAAASEIQVRCPRGSEYSGRPQWREGVPAEVSVKRFPLLVPRPVPADGFSGRIALSRFLLGTGSRFYDPYYLALPNDVFAYIENNRISHFEGDAADVKRVEEHYRHVSSQLCIEPWYVDSWHAGIHPGCRVETSAETDLIRWSGSAFGNPRVLHFHTCGEYAPGEISWHLFDPTVCIDGVAVWDNGRLYPDRVPGGAEILARHPNLAALFDNPYREIGLAG